MKSLQEHKKNIVQNTSEMVQIVAKELIDFEEFDRFEWRRRKQTFKLKQTFGHIRVHLSSRSGFNFETNSRSIILTPQVLLRHDVLHEWFSEFSFKSNSDQSDSWTIGYVGHDVNLSKEYVFHCDYSNFKTELVLLRNAIKQMLEEIKQYCDIQYVYRNKIHNMVNDVSFKLPNYGVEWAFRALILVNNFDVLNYKDFKSRILEHLSKLNLSREPNVRRYFKDLDQIIRSLENVTVTN